jgi:predicted transposase YbfD/YdcC
MEKFMSDKNCGIGNFFDKIEDPRINRTRMHELIDIITIGLCSILAGCEGFSDMEHFGNSKQDWFNSFLRLPNGIPSHDTFRRVFSSINPKQFESAFFKWTNAIVSEINGRHIAVDGKCLRASGRKRTKKSPIHLVSAWCSDEGGIIVGQEKTDEKSNEITAIPHLLEALDLKGAIVSIDAAGCQKNIAKQITEQEGDFVLALKGNHKKLHEEVQEKSQEWISKTSNFNEDNFHDYFDESHGRLVRRRIWVITKLDLKNLTEWPHVKSILVVENISFDIIYQVYLK